MLWNDPRWFVWSSGLQEWEPIAPLTEWTGMPLRFSHEKTWNSRKFLIYVDGTGRYIGALDT